MNSNRVWILKDATHMLFLDSLLEVFPDAQIVVTHRNPTQVVGSCCSGFQKLSSFYYQPEDVNPIALGERVIHFLRESIERMTRLRLISCDTHVSSQLGRAGENTFFDFHYEEFLNDPIETLRGIYQHFGDHLEADVEERMESFLEKNRQNKHGRHVYSLEQFGITPEQLDTFFGEYCEQYNVPFTPAKSL